MDKQELKELLAARNDDVQTFITWQLEKRGGHANAIRFALDLIDQLDEPEITEEQAWKVIELENGYHLAPAHTKVYKEAIQNGVKPECFNELTKPVIPQFVADWIEKCKDGEYNLFGVFDYAQGEVKDWIFNEGIKNKKINLVARAWLDGYMIEKEPRWIVERENGDYVELFEDSLYGLDISITSSLDAVSPHRFTNEAKAEAVALLVGGTVKEIPEDEAMKLIEGWKG